MSLPRSSPRPRWWMTTSAFSSLLAELERVDRDVAGDRLRDDEDDGLLRLPSTEPITRQRVLREIRDEAGVDDTPGCAVIGRRVTVHDLDAIDTYALVLPGDGDPAQGWISADSPLGAAVLGRRPGDVVTVVAPAGPRLVRVVAVE